ATFFDNDPNEKNYAEKNTDIGEPEDIYIEDGKTYKTYIEVGENDKFKLGRGIIGLKDDGSMIYHTLETSATSHYNKSEPSTKEYAFDSYVLEILGENVNNAIYEYPLLENGVLNYMCKPAFYTSDMGTKNLDGATVYKVKCSQYRRAHSGVNGYEIGSKTYYFEGSIEDIVIGTSSMQAPAGYVYLATYQPLEHLQKNTVVRGNKKMTGEWADASYVFGFKQQILLDGEPLFDDAERANYGSNPTYGSWNDWTEDVKYASYGSNRTALGFKADGTPVIITSQRNVYEGYPTIKDTDGVDLSNELGVTYYEMAWYMKSLGCVNAFMLDCGGSMGMYKKQTGSDTYEVACCEPLHTQPNRPVANALILAYPSGDDAIPTDEILADPALAPQYITAQTNPAWHAGDTNLRTSVATNEKNYNFYSDSTLNSKISDTNFTVTQSGTTYDFAPGSISSSYESVYAYTKLGYTVEEGSKYVYCFKLHTANKGKYTSFLFGEYPTNTTSSKMLNNFAVVGGAFSNNGDSGGSDVRVGVGRVKAETADVHGLNQNINLYLETSASKNYSFYRIDIDGLNYTLKTLNSSGNWVQIGETYALPAGTQLIMGCASWTSDLSVRKMSVKDAICVDVTELSNKTAVANSLNSTEYTADSWKALEDARTKAQYSAKIPYQNLVDYANTELYAAMNGLVKRTDVTDANIAEYEASNSSLYVFESWANYQAAYQALVAAKNSNDLASMDALNKAYEDAKNALVPIDISVDIFWQGMNFVYVESGSQVWNPQTHEYEGEISATWNGNDNSVIDVTNRSNVDISVKLDFIPSSDFSNLSGDFYSEGILVNDKVVLSENASEQFNCKLSGSIPSTTKDNTSGGKITVTVSSNQ
ncbi:MAG: phosphodiester glycosidase family protein, partial [Ruminococcaceae bacterium]|nr:phosphodiester glycosidase family protein [Oscillospiraceae bacterium]